jgi:hypothetical protein
VPARTLVEVDLDFHDKALTQIEAELMEKLRAALSPAVQTELAQVARTVPSGRCASCGAERRFLQYYNYHRLSGVLAG